MRISIYLLLFATVIVLAHKSGEREGRRPFTGIVKTMSQFEYDDAIIRSRLEGYTKGMELALEVFKQPNCYLGPLELGPGSHSVSNCIFISLGDGVSMKCDDSTNKLLSISGGYFFSHYLPIDLDMVKKSVEEEKARKAKGK